MTIDSIIKSKPWYERMEILRASKKWDQERAAQACGTTKKNYWLWSQGKSFPRLNSRKAIAAAFEVTVDEIFG